MDSIAEHGDALVKQCVLLAMKNDRVALRLCMSWLAGIYKPAGYNLRLPQVKTAADIPAAVQCLSRAVARRKISPQEAEALLNVLQRLRREFELQAQPSPSVAEGSEIDLGRLTDEEFAQMARLLDTAKGENNP
jgi:hypothetical protein